MWELHFLNLQVRNASTAKIQDHCLEGLTSKNDPDDSREPGRTACLLQVFGASLLEEAAREAGALSFSRPSIVRLHAAFVFEDAAVLVVEYAGEALSKLAFPLHVSLEFGQIIFSLLFLY